MNDLIQRNKWFFILFSFGWIVLFVLRMFLDKGQLLLEVSEYRTLGRNSFFMFATRFGEVIAFIGFSICFLTISYRAAVSIGLSGIAVLIISNLLKGLFQYERPLLYFRNIGLEHDFPKIEGLEPYIGLTSFPSGHTMGAFALMAIASFYVKNEYVKVILFALASLVAFSRIYLGHHFLEDIIFGSVVGFAIAIGLFLLMSKLNHPFWDKRLVTFRFMVKKKA